jgi:hypothetical protein
MRITLVMAALAIALLVGAGGTIGAPSPMTWTDVGSRSASSGTFTAAAPLCPSGTVTDIGGLVGIKTRHTCADGSGTFEFETSGGASVWRFSAGGTGRYAALRGSGTCHVTVNDDAFIRTCEAVADFDNTPPTVRIERLRIARSGRADAVQMTFNTTDNVAANPVSYRVAVLAAGRRIGSKVGTRAGGTMVIVIKVRPPKRARRLTVVLSVADPLENARSVSRSVRLHH